VDGRSSRRLTYDVFFACYRNVHPVVVSKLLSYIMWKTFTFLVDSLTRLNRHDPMIHRSGIATIEGQRKDFAMMMAHRSALAYCALLAFAPREIASGFQISTRTLVSSVQVRDGTWSTFVWGSVSGPNRSAASSLFVHRRCTSALRAEGSASSDDEVEGLFQSESEKKEAVGNLVEDDEWMGLSMELGELVRTAIIEDLKKNARDFLGKEEYKVGDISKEIDTRVKEEVARFRGCVTTCNESCYERLLGRQWRLTPESSHFILFCGIPVKMITSLGTSCSPWTK
jgi:hypothetical protein